MSDQNYSVNYKIIVEATEGVKQVDNFANSVSRIALANKSLDSVVANVQRVMNGIDKLFRDKNGRKKNYQYTFNLDTKGTEDRLELVKTKLVEIKDLIKGIKLNINTGKLPNAKQLGKQLKPILNPTNTNDKSALVNSQNVIQKQRSITRAIGKINSGLLSLEKGRKVNIDITETRQKLNEILVLLGRIRSRTNGSMALSMGFPPITGYGKIGAVMPINDKLQQRTMERLYTQQQLHQQRMLHRKQQDLAKRLQQEEDNRRKQQEAIRRKAFADEEKHRKDKEKRDRKRREDEEKRRRRDASAAVREAQHHSQLINTANNSRQRGAINRLQYAKAPSIRNLPFGYMFNAYMGYTLMRRQLTEAVEYANIMESARSILKVADSDLGTFETRFDQMARYVRQIGVETKFTAIEVAGAVKYLSMAGMNMETINNSIRPITNLALIGDNDISQIADLSTNIMAGYNIKSESMSKVADILASTVSRSNVNIIEMAESFKMAAGYMKLSGVAFTETSAAIGILGNMGIKGTMAGTALRAMSTRFAKPPKEARKVLDRLNIKFTHKENVFGEEVEKLRPLADIFEELNKKGATLQDMVTIFGKIGGNAGMMFLNNYEQLRVLASQNRASQGISGELAKVKQETTKGLWFQMTSMFSEGFMQGYEVLEPQIKGVLKDFIAKFKTEDFAKGLTSIGSVLLDLLSALGKIATWFVSNFHWIEPILFTGIVATRLFKLAGALTNVGVALGFIGKQSATASAFNVINGLSGIGGMRGLRGLRGLRGAMSITDKRALVTALRGAGVTGGRGAMTGALASISSPLLLRSGLFASQVTTGNGLLGAGASLSAIGTGALAATAGLSALAGVIGYAAYKTWKLKEAKDAVLEEIKADTKYRYPSIEALYGSLKNAYEMAKSTKQAVDDVTSGKTVEQSSGHTAGWWTNNWWGVIDNWFAGANGFHTKNAAYINAKKNKGPTTFDEAKQLDILSAVETIAKKDSQQRVNSAIAEIAKLKEPYLVGGFIDNIQKSYGQSNKDIDLSLYDKVGGVATGLKEDIMKLPEAYASKTKEYANYQNTHTVKDIQVFAEGYQKAISDYGSAKSVIERTGFRFNELEKSGFYKDNNGKWVQKELVKGSPEEEKRSHYNNYLSMRESIKHVTIALRQQFGNSTEIAETILQKAGITSNLYSNEPDSKDKSPWDANGISSTDADDGKSGGNYSGTGKLSSAAPKQVIVNISNLLSVDTIDLMKSKEGQEPEIQNLKEQLAQALIDVVHDFDASWNG